MACGAPEEASLLKHPNRAPLDVSDLAIEIHSENGDQIIATV